MNKKYLKKKLHITNELYEKLNNILENQKKYNFQTELIRAVWKDYLNNPYDLKGYSNIIGKKINTKNMNKEIQVTFPNPELKKTIEIYLEKMKIKYYDKGKEFYKFTYVTAELLENYIKEKEGV